MHDFDEETDDDLGHPASALIPEIDLVNATVRSGGARLHAERPRWPDSLGSAL